MTEIAPEQNSPEQNSNTLPGEISMEAAIDLSHLSLASSASCKRGNC